MYNTVESNKKKIALNKELIKNRKKRKQEFLAYNEYRANLQSNLYNHLGDINSIKKELQKSETESKLAKTKEIVPFVEEPESSESESSESDDEEKRRLYHERLNEAYKKLGVFEPAISELPPTMRFVVHIDPHSKKITMYINENEKHPITEFNPLKETFNLGGFKYWFNKNVIHLMRGGTDWKEYLPKDIEQYLNILDEVNTSKKSDRYKKVKDMVKKYNESKRKSRISSLQGGTPRSATDRPKISIFNKYNEPPSSGSHSAVGSEAHSGKGLSSTQIVFLPDNPVELFDRLRILITARNEGHNSSENEIHAILKRLLEQNLITKEKYKFFLR